MTRRHSPQGRLLPALSDGARREVMDWLEACKESMEKTKAYTSMAAKLYPSLSNENHHNYAVNAIKTIKWLMSVADMKRGKQEDPGDAIP